MDAGKYSVFLDRIKTGQPRGRDGAGAKSRACGCNGTGVWKNISGGPDDLQLEEADAESSA